MRRDWYETVPSFLPAEWGVGVGIASVVQCPVCTVYSVLCTVLYSAGVLTNSAAYTHFSSQCRPDCREVHTTLGYNTQLLLQWDKQLVTLTTSENNKYVNYNDFVTCENVVNLNHKKVGNLIVYLFKVSPKLRWKEILIFIFGYFHYWDYNNSLLEALNFCCFVAK